jgi:hypothetical protein
MVIDSFDKLVDFIDDKIEVGRLYGNVRAAFLWRSQNMISEDQLMSALKEKFNGL